MVKRIKHLDANLDLHDIVHGVELKLLNAFGLRVEQRKVKP